MNQQVILSTPTLEESAIADDKRLHSGMSLGEVFSVDRHRSNMEMGFDAEYMLPPALRHEAYSVNAWNQWYGSQKAALRAAETLLSVRTQETTPLLKRLRGVKPLALMTSILNSSPLSRAFLSGLSPAASALVSPESRVSHYIQSQYGERYSDACEVFTAGSATLSARLVEYYWPFMGALHDRGGYSPNSYWSMLYLGFIAKKLNGDEKMTANERGQAMIAVNLICRSMQPRLAALVVIHTKAFAEAFTYSHKFYGLTASTLDPSRSIWAQVTAEDVQATADYLSIIAGQFKPEPQNHYEEILLPLEAWAVVNAGYGKHLKEAYQRFCTEHAAPRYQRLREALQRYGELLEIKLNQKDYPADLIGRSVDFSDVATPEEALIMLRMLMTFEMKNFDVEAFTADADKRMSKISEIHQAITQRSAAPTVSNMLQIAKLAEDAKDQILANRDWFKDMYNQSKAYVSLWSEFYERVASVKAKKTVQSEKAHLAKVVESTVVSASPVVTVPNDHAAELGLALADIEHLSTELRESKAENHRLRAAAGAMASKTTREKNPLECAAVINRVVMRQNHKPADVLDYFDCVAKDRIVVLDSARRSVSAYTANFDGTERMLDLMHKLVYGYLDAINTGSPDTVARKAFGPKAYSAQESQTTLSDARLRAMREFAYEGKKRLFTRHLRVGNATGQEGMRIYFDIIDGLVVLAYVGPHLEVRSSS
ncbi:hypothetical protein [Pseudomonas sp. 2FE]|uniref:hypothetical protein n=1 Tax=Pseudomonas sp. 2FE TaxID=2502190 RepID=UPI0010F5237A|nr:hypothetical protein [Pseudomonas sp. 2FE]